MKYFFFPIFVLSLLLSTFFAAAETWDCKITGRFDKRITSQDIVIQTDQDRLNIFVSSSYALKNDHRKLRGSFTRRRNPNSLFQWKVDLSEPVSIGTRHPVRRFDYRLLLNEITGKFTLSIAPKYSGIVAHDSSWRGHEKGSCSLRN